MDRARNEEIVFKVGVERNLMKYRKETVEVLEISFKKEKERKKLLTDSGSF